MKKMYILCGAAFFSLSVFAVTVAGQERKLDKIRVGGGSTSA